MIRINQEDYLSFKLLQDNEKIINGKANFDQRLTFPLYLTLGLS